MADLEPRQVIAEAIFAARHPGPYRQGSEPDNWCYQYADDVLDHLHAHGYVIAGTETGEGA